MFTAIILMCTIDNYCYTITNQDGLYATEQECQLAIDELLTNPYFSLLYREFDGQHTFNVIAEKCINWGRSA